jgi:hypothetical protein
MLTAADGMPQVDRRSKCLGVREPPGEFADIDIDHEGKVLLNRKGLSVADDWRRLPGHLIPEHLDDGLNGASGRSMRVFVHGEGHFEEGPVAERLELRYKPDSTTAGVVCPSGSVLLRQFQSDLAATRAQWHIDES